MLPTANTVECFTFFRNKKLKGFLFNNDGARVMIYEDGNALAFDRNGAYWVISAEDVNTMITNRIVQVRAMIDELKRLNSVLEDIPTPP